jgi:hypothetical protein
MRLRKTVRSKRYKKISLSCCVVGRGRASGGREAGPTRHADPPRQREGKANSRGGEGGREGGGGAGTGECSCPRGENGLFFILILAGKEQRSLKKKDCVCHYDSLVLAD